MLMALVSRTLSNGEGDMSIDELVQTSGSTLVFIRRGHILSHMDTSWSTIHCIHPIDSCAFACLTVHIGWVGRRRLNSAATFYSCSRIGVNCCRRVTSSPISSYFTMINPIVMVTNPKNTAAVIGSPKNTQPFSAAKTGATYPMRLI